MKFILELLCQLQKDRCKSVRLEAGVGTGARGHFNWNQLKQLSPIERAADSASRCRRREILCTAPTPPRGRPASHDSWTACGLWLMPSLLSIATLAEINMRTLKKCGGFEWWPLQSIGILAVVCTLYEGSLFQIPYRFVYNVWAVTSYCSLWIRSSCVRDK